MDFVARMELGRTLAKRRRDRGWATGKGGKGWDYKRPLDTADDWGSLYRRTFNDWKSAAREALNDFQVASLNGPRSDVYDYEF
jgi:hypothetical protein